MTKLIWVCKIFFLFQMLSDVYGQCPLECINGACKEADGICECFVGAFGAQCEIVPCEDECAYNVECVYDPVAMGGKCNCTEGLSGVLCDVLTCDTVCTDPHVCVYNMNLQKTECGCPTGLGGPECTDPVCDPPCMNNGVCAYLEDEGLSICDCIDARFTGQQCEIAICDPPCENEGSCEYNSMNDVNECVCPSWLTGEQCQTPFCDPVCENGGTCDYDSEMSTSYCDCPDDFDGPQCELPFCFPDCVDGEECVYDEENSITMCQVVSADPCDPSPCVNGTCLISTGPDGFRCFCNPGFMGPLCDEAKQPDGVWTGPTATPRTTPTCVDASFCGTTKKGNVEWPEQPHCFVTCGHRINPECQCCPAGLFYVEKCDRCLEENDEALCPTSTTTTTTPRPTQSQSGINDFCSNKEAGHYQDTLTYNEHNFIQCNHGNGYRMTCGDILVWCQTTTNSGLCNYKH